MRRKLVFPSPSFGVVEAHDEDRASKKIHKIPVFLIPLLLLRHAWGSQQVVPSNVLVPLK